MAIYESKTLFLVLLGFMIVVLIFYVIRAIPGYAINLNIGNCVSLKITTTVLLVIIIVKPVQNGHSKIMKTKVSMTTGNLMKIESIAENAPFGAFCNIFDLH